MRVLVCGGRDFADKSLLERTLSSLGITEICHGAARGADTLAGQWAALHKIPVKEYPAQWNTWGKSAGYRRNVEMIQDFAPDKVVAFPGGRGTQHMIDIARQRGVPVLEIR